MKSFTQAAKNLNIAQAAVSSRIAALQEELGVTLVDRRDKEFYLTESGELSTPSQRLARPGGRHSTGVLRV